MSDLSLSINIKAVDAASNVLSSLANGIGSNFKDAFGNIKFAMQNMGTEGTLTKDALVAAAGDMGMALAGVGVVGVAAAATIGAQATKMAGAFEEGMTSLVTG